MTVGELKTLLTNVDDSAPVVLSWQGKDFELTQSNNVPQTGVRLALVAESQRHF